MERRQFLRTSTIGVAAAAAATTLAAPAIAQSVFEWRMVHSWPKNLPGVGAGAERLAERITRAGRITLRI